MLIQTQAELADICQRLGENDYLTIDTEFLRERTYRAQLCLIQLAGPDIDPVMIDPIETDLDLAPFFTLMQKKDTVKVFHAARQDLEILYDMDGKLPAPLFDTQIAAMVCGYGEQISYAKLVEAICNHPLAKSSQFTDWTRRPLSQKQIDYALSDVTYLRDIYESLSAQLRKMNRAHWLEAEMAALTDPESYNPDPQEAWKRVKIRTDKPKTLAVLRALAAWREEEASRRNLPRGFVIKDDALAAIALGTPKDEDALSRIRGLSKNFSGSKNGKIVLKLVAEALASPKNEWPESHRKAPLPGELGPALELLKLLLRLNAMENEIAPKLVAKADDLESYVRDPHGDHPVNKGWRYEIFGRDAQRLLDGTLFFGLNNGQIVKQEK